MSKHFKSSKVKVYKHVFVFGPMRPKARGLAQRGGPPGCDLASVILYVMDGPHRLPFPYRSGRPDRSCPAAH
jgi:hypothetical protein